MSITNYTITNTGMHLIYIYISIMDIMVIWMDMITAMVYPKSMCQSQTSSSYVFILGGLCESSQVDVKCDRSSSTCSGGSWVWKRKATERQGRWQSWRKARSSWLLGSLGPSFHGPFGQVLGAELQGFYHVLPLPYDKCGKNQTESRYSMRHVLPMSFPSHPGRVSHRFFEILAFQISNIIPAQNIYIYQHFLSSSHLCSTNFNNTWDSYGFLGSWSPDILEMTSASTVRSTLDPPLQVAECLASPVTVEKFDEHSLQETNIAMENHHL